MGDRVAVIKDGILQQVATPQNLYDSPNNIFVASFIGSPSMNLFAATMTVDDGGVSVVLGSNTLRASGAVLAARPALSGYDGKPVTVGIRPEDMDDAALKTDHPTDQRFTSSVRLIESLGAEIMLHFTVDAPGVDAGDPDALDDVVTDDSGTRCVARFNPRSSVRLGGPVEVAVNTERLHFFDSDTGLAITD